MTTNTIIADGQTKTFYFTFPFFLKSDVIIEVNSQPATNYSLICNKNGLNADVPFIGGEVHFNKPPQTGSVITIKRKLPVKRIVDYQPTVPYDPIAHNQDMNYVLEILRDMQAEVEAVTALPSDAANKNAIDIISGQIADIISVLDEIRNNPTQPGATVDLSEINSAIEGLTSSINALNTRCDQLGDAIENIPDTSLPDDIDYVVASQLPTAGNNYTWYRKYASGWVEQGGEITAASVADGSGSAGNKSITLPVEMGNNNYHIKLQTQVGSSGWNYANGVILNARSTTTLTIKVIAGTGSTIVFWQVSGIAA